MKNFIKRCWQRRWIRRLTWTGVSLVTLYALLCAWVNWSGARQWRDVQAMLKAEGETIDFRAIMREPIPETDNFCAIPLLKDLVLVVDGDQDKGAPAEKRKRLEAVKLPSGDKVEPRPKFASVAHGRHLDPNAWAAWLRKEGTLTMPTDSGDAARDLLAALSKDDGIFAELAAGLNRPEAQWTPEWKTRELPEIPLSIALPHYSVAWEVSQTLALRASVSTRAGETAKAHESMLILARFSEASLNDPLLIGQLVGARNTPMLCGLIGELCEAHLGTAEDFARLESTIARLDFQRALLNAFRGDMAGSVNTLQYMKVSRGSMLGLFEMMNNEGGANSGLLDNVMSRAVPTGIFDANTAVLADREFKYMIKPLRDKGWAAAFKAAEDLEIEFVGGADIWANPSSFMALLMVPDIKGICYRAAYAQTLIDQAVIACALERHFLEKGNYPDSLDAVKLADGKPLPLDPMSDKPMGYRKTADGKYTLWSVGIDGKDEGGKRVLDEKKPEDTKFQDAKYLGDWVWDFPAK